MDIDQFFDIATNPDKINEIIRQAFVEVVSDPLNQAVIIDFNTQDQLFERGEDATGTKLSDIGGDYAPVTINIKTIEGQPTDRVTLRDEGDFYNSFTIEVGQDYFEIQADTVKDGEDLRARWGDNIIGLNESNLQKLIDLVSEQIGPIILRGLGLS